MSVDLILDNRVYLSSHRRMIVNSFLKTGSTKPIFKPCVYVDDELNLKSKLSLF